MARFKALASKALVFILAVLVIVMNGELVYTNSFHIKSVNGSSMLPFICFAQDSTTKAQ